MIDAEFNGLILWHGAAQAVRVERSLLMLDAVSWAKWIAAKKREEAARWEREDRIRALAELKQQIREIDRWLVTRDGKCQSTYVLHRRVLFGTPVVTSENYDVYLRRLLRLRAEASHAPTSEFLLDADNKPLTLHLLEDMSAAVQHTGPYVQGRVVDQREMLRLVLEALRESNRSLRLFLQQDDLLN